MGEQERPDPDGNQSEGGGGPSHSLAIHSQVSEAIQGEDFSRVEENVRAGADFFKIASHSPATLRAYKTSWLQFDTWCQERALSSLPASRETIALYLSSRALAGRRPATINKDAAGIHFVHDRQGHPSPVRTSHVTETVRGIRRTVGAAQSQKKPIRPELLGQMFAKLPDRLSSIRTQALLAIGFSAALRRSELVALDVDDLEFRDQGLVLHIRKSKTDQEQKGHKIAIKPGKHIDPVGLLRRWLKHAGIKEGAVFRSFSWSGELTERRLSVEAVAWIIHKAAKSLGLEPLLYAGHSLRSGFATTAAEAKVDLLTIKKQTRHKSIDMLDRYIRDAALFDDTVDSLL